ncbi:hypothetical protein ES703_34356 [subsurface metagenome]
MNKILAYTVIAILLGTVTMVAPLALLGPEDSITDTEPTLTVPEYTVTGPEAGEPNDQENFFGADKMLECGSYSVQRTTPDPEPSEPAATPDVSPEEPELAVKTADDSTDLSPIGLMTIPSFLVALGVFVYLRKRIS